MRRFCSPKFVVARHYPSDEVEPYEQLEKSDEADIFLSVWQALAISDAEKSKQTADKMIKYR